MVYSCTSISSTYCLEVYSGVTSPGTALGKGEKINVSASTSRDVIALWFDLTNQQWIDISEVGYRDFDMNFIDTSVPFPTLPYQITFDASLVTALLLDAWNRTFYF